MLRKTLYSLSFLLMMSAGLSAQNSFGTTHTIELPISDFPAIANPNRAADHATVAINSNKDIFVAYHTTRSLDGAQYNQAEGVFIDYNSDTNDWKIPDEEDVYTLGIPEAASCPTAGYFPYASCDKPDVVAVGDRFLVVWTRFWKHEIDADIIAWIEAAWLWKENDKVEYSPSSIEHGRGSIVHSRDYFSVGISRGVPDAVALEFDENTEFYKGGVVYVEQTTETPPLRFNINFSEIMVTGSINSYSDYGSVVSDIPFYLSGSQSHEYLTKGYILPDVVKSRSGRLALVHEMCENVSGDPLYLIRLHILDRGINWLSLDYLEFETNSTYIHRRPNISSDPQETTGDRVSVAWYNREIDNLLAEKNVDYRHVVVSYDESVSYRVTNLAYPNGQYENNIRPVPCHRQEDKLKGIFAQVTNPITLNTNLIATYHPQSSLFSPIPHSPLTLTTAERPAIDFYEAQAPEVQNLIPLTCEGYQESHQGIYRLFLRIMAGS